MTEAAALRPLWTLTTAVALGAGACLFLDAPLGWQPQWPLAALGLGALALALRRGPAPRAAALWFCAGLALAGARGLDAWQDRQTLIEIMASSTQAAVRVEATVLEGWTVSRWGRRTRLDIRSATHNDRPVQLPPRSALELRGSILTAQLPPPGSRFRALLALRGRPTNPLLVASAPSVLTEIAPPHGLPHWRQRICDALLSAAGTDPDRVQAAELAAALAVGRRDLIPDARREAWRASGFAHLLAVSGLHVGIVGGLGWLLAVAAGLRPPWARGLVLLVLPVYTLLTGAPPSAVRAALMGMVYLGARFLGRPLVPMAAVLLAALGLLLHRPELVGDAGFQLTVVITAALVRWVPPLTRAIPGPTWFSASVAVPLVAQLTALPLVALHFRTLVPGALLANLAVLPLLTPLLVAALTATAGAVIHHAAGAVLLETLHPLQELLWRAGGLARGELWLLPPPPLLVTALFAGALWWALRPAPGARRGAVLAIAIMVVTGSWWAVRPAPRGPRATVLPVAEGAAVVVSAGDGTQLLLDGGQRPRECAELLSEMPVRRLDLVVASHSDEDHIGGLATVLETVPTTELLLPAWMLGDPAAQKLLRAARRGGVRIRPAVTGMEHHSGEIHLSVLWPPREGLPRNDNDRSLVLRIKLPDGQIFFTGDAGGVVERRLARGFDLSSDILVVGHHGSRHSTSEALLAACRPTIALIPAGTLTPHNHPSPEVVGRLIRHRIMQRAPVRDGWCGALLAQERWRPFP